MGLCMRTIDPVQGGSQAAPLAASFAEDSATIAAHAFSFLLPRGIFIIEEDHHHINK